MFKKILIFLFWLLTVWGCKRYENIREESIKYFKKIYEFPLPGYPEGLFLKEKLLYVADGQAGFVILNLENLPDTIILLSKVETGYNAKSICVHDTFLFLGFNDVNRRGVWVYNISDVYNPFFLTADEGVSFSYDLFLPPQDTNIIYSASGYYYFIFTTDYLPFYLYSKDFIHLEK